MGFLLAVGGAIILLDQITKMLIIKFLPLMSAVTVIPGFFNIVHVRNPGGAFSFLAGAGASWRPFFFLAMSLLGTGIIVYAYRKVEKRDFWNRCALALLFGGALGNLIDRLRFGEVVDFLDFYIGAYHWPAFNVADSAISVGAVMLLIVLLRK